MRIIAGAHKGRTLKTPNWEGLRPTSDRLRETLFNILAPRIAGARVLDAFAGTGAVALEALSRGAAAAVCVERDRRAAALLEENRARVGEESGCMILRDDARRALAAPVPGGPFDIVFLDPRTICPSWTPSRPGLPHSWRPADCWCSSMRRAGPRHT
ncbi:MAG: 16S rRNA (guanine(966)-N(2))-methyltransferase RsmD [Vicinamibacterales bacterium]